MITPKELIECIFAIVIFFGVVTVIVYEKNNPPNAK